MNTSEIETWLLGDELASDLSLQIGSDLLRLQEAESFARQKLQALDRSSDFSAKMKVASGEEIVEARSTINRANGAHAAAIDTIFRSQEFFKQNAGNLVTLDGQTLQIEQASISSLRPPGDPR